MEAAVQELLCDFFHQASVGTERTDVDQPLERLADDGQSDSAVCKRDLRRLLEKDPAGFFQAACRILKESADKAGTEPLLEVLWSSSLLLTSLIDPRLLPLAAATSLARRWVAFDPMVDIKLLQIGFPLGEDDAIAPPDMAQARRALEIVSELPPNRHVLLSLAKLLRNLDPYIRSKAALLYARASRNPDWVRKMLAESDARVRANAVEGLWDTSSPLAATLFREAALDPDHRVAANALIGLHRCGEADDVVTDVLGNMARSQNPLARAAAAFAIGQIRMPDCVSMLEHLLRDSDAGVRGQALRSLISVRRLDRRETAGEKAPAPEADVAAEPVPAPALPAA